MVEADLCAIAKGQALRFYGPPTCPGRQPFPRPAATRTRALPDLPFWLGACMAHVLAPPRHLGPLGVPILSFNWVPLAFLHAGAPVLFFASTRTYLWQRLR